MKTQVLYESEKTKTFDANSKPLRIVGTVKLFVHAGKMTELVKSFVCKWQAILDILGCDFYDQFLECIYPKTRTVEFSHASTAPIIQNYGEQRSVVIDNTNGVGFQEGKGRVFPKIRSTQRVLLPPFSQTMITVQIKRERLTLAAPKTSTENVWSATLLVKLKTSDATCLSVLLSSILREIQNRFPKTKKWRWQKDYKNKSQHQKHPQKTWWKLQQP